jgi:hypothetical protein
MAVRQEPKLLSMVVVGLFIKVANEELTRISILRVKANIVAVGTVKARGDSKKSFTVEFNSFNNGNLESMSVGILASHIGFLAPCHDKVTLE